MELSEIIALIKQEVGKQFSNKMVGDTPNDALQLTPKKYVDGKVLSGYVNSNASVVYAPTGWIVSLSSTGNYLIKHNLGTTNYSFVAFADSTNSLANNTGAVVASGYLPDANQITVLTINVLNGTNTGAINAPFWFIVTKK